MKIIMVGFFLCLILLGLTPVNAPAQINRNGDRVCFYQDINYRGWEQCYAAGVDIENLGGRRNEISSIRVFNGAHVIVYEDTDFSGRSAEFRSDIPDLSRVGGGRSWSDRIGSLRVSAGIYDNDFPVYRGGNNSSNNNGRGVGRGNGRQWPIRDGICVYENVNFSGYSECWESDQQVRDLGRFGGWNDLISSVRVFGRASAVFYRNVGFGGERIVIDRDIPDLGRFRLSGSQSWNDQVSSMQLRSNNRAYR